MTRPSPVLGLVDSHCHVQQIDAGERDRALDFARERGVEGFLVPAIHLEDAETLFELADGHADVWIALGVHPHEAKRWRDGDGGKLRELLDHPKVVAVGECGLDFHYDYSPRERQRRAMREQWEVAIDRGLPVIVHNRESDADALELLGDPAFAGLTGVFHSYCSAAATAREILAHGGFRLGISGMVTFRAAENVREVLAFTPLDRLLVETDTPFLAPAPYRGRPNQPAWVVEVAARLAEEVGVPVDQVHRVTGAAFTRTFLDGAAPASGPASR